VWKIELSAKAEKQFGKLDRQTKLKLVDYFVKLSYTPDPLAFGRPLV
jgi:mRNA-degrading endonuclease RelE of RelBE toxin-antitoxin system